MSKFKKKHHLERPILFINCTSLLSILQDTGTVYKIFVTIVYSFVKGYVCRVLCLPINS